MSNGTTTKKRKTPAKKKSEGEKTPRPRNSGMFKKGNTIGCEYWFAAGNTASLKYTDEYADLLIQYALSDEAIVPSLTGFAVYAKVSPAVLDIWKHKYPRFSEACNYLEKIREAKLTEGGATRRLDASISKFLLSALHGYSEKTKTEAEVKQEITVTINGIE